MSAKHEPHGLTPTIRLHEVTMAALARRPAATETLTTKENAKGEGLIEGLTTIRAEHESSLEWVARHCEMHALIARTLRPGGTEDHSPTTTTKESIA